MIITNADSGKRYKLKKIACTALLLLLVTRTVPALDWPQYRASASRDGYTAEELGGDLSLRWVYRARHAPRPAWRGDDTRMPFDYAYQTVIADGTIYFGSSADGRIYALDAASGRQRWAFYTGGPVRFAPALWRDRVLAVSDDGCLYCLSAKDGRLLWKLRGGPEDDLIIGNENMVSRWPARGGVVVLDNIAYFAAGVWPSDGIYLYAVNPENGKVIWLNDDSGPLEMDKPHGGARAKSGISAQGYLLASAGNLLVPTGRAVPAVFSLDEGRLRYFHHQKHRAWGGSRISTFDGFFLCDGGNQRQTWQPAGTSKGIFVTKSGLQATTQAIPSTAIAVTPDYLIYADPEGVHALDRTALLIEKDRVDRQGNKVKVNSLTPPTWNIPMPPGPGGNSLIAAGNKIICGTTNNKVVLLDSKSKRATWSAAVEGQPLGLAVADGRLFVSTDRGLIYCFKSGRDMTGPAIRIEPESHSQSSDELYAAAAGEIIDRTGIVDGYCLDLGCGDGRLAYELARRTNLTIYAVDPDPKNVARARERLETAGLYGVRVTVHQGDPARTNYPKYFANLVISGRSVAGETGIVKESEINRVLRPYGGTALIGAPGGMKKSVRESLVGADPEWSHQYHDPANTITSSDELVKGPLSILWFNDNDLDMPSRHGRGVGPLFSKGRLFVEGLNALRAMDAYNGRTLWELPLPDIMKLNDQEHLVGTAGTHGNMCLEADRIYLRSGGDRTNGDYAGKSCLVIETATGRRSAEYRMPAGPEEDNDRYWGYIAVDDGTLFGSVADLEHIVGKAYRESDMNKLFTESREFFAMDAASGEPKWTFTPEHSIRHNAIAIGGGVVYLIDRAPAIADAIRRNPHRRQAGSETAPAHPLGKLLALDASTGKTIWQNDKNIYGTLLALSIEHDVLVMTYQFTTFRQPSELGGMMTAFRASTGERLWEIPTGDDGERGRRYKSRAMINDRVVYLEPDAYDLLTGNKLDFDLQRSYNCGIIAGCRNTLVFRSATLGYVDLTAADGTENFGGLRPGCWINALPVGGIVIMPDATARCNCSYLNKASIALLPVGE
ncbi:PQQ-binding-like beta-propeller repeat protein [candidate division KSB1 bacterium]